MWKSIVQTDHRWQFRMLGNQGYRHTFITFNTYFLFDGKKWLCERAFYVNTHIACLVSFSKSLCYSCSYLHSPPTNWHLCCRLAPDTQCSTSAPSESLRLASYIVVQYKMKSNFRSLGTQRQTRHVVLGDTWSILWTDRDIPWCRQADDHTAKHGTVIREMAIGGCDGELVTLSLSRPTPCHSPHQLTPEAQTCFTSCRLYQNKNKKSVKNNDTTQPAWFISIKCWYVVWPHQVQLFIAPNFCV